jgi:hypothetical protein
MFEISISYYTHRGQLPLPFFAIDVKDGASRKDLKGLPRRREQMVLICAAVAARTLEAIRLRETCLVSGEQMLAGIRVTKLSDDIYCARAGISHACTSVSLPSEIFRVMNLWSQQILGMPLLGSVLA